MKSVMNHSFSRVPTLDIPRAAFDRSHGLKTTFNSGYLIPIFLDEALPGDTFVLRGNGFARMATPLYPVMDNMFMETFFFFVPKRLVWNNFQKMMGEQDNPTDSVDFEVPILRGVASAGASFTFTEQSIFDYFGLPTQIAFSNADEINALPLRAANLIYNSWFRDQNLQDSLTVNKDDGPDLVNVYDLFRRGKRHDYFTSCLPWPQKGPDVSLPLGSSAVVEYSHDTTDPWLVRLASTGAIPATTDGIFHTAGDLQITGPIDVQLDPNGSLIANLSTATSATLSQFREAIQLQALYERDARGGTRYTEIIHSHFGVTSDDARLQRPEYLGGGSTRINVNPIASTAASYDRDVSNNAQFRKLGELGGMAVGSFQNHGFTKSFTEHGYVIGFVNVRADLTYQQGLNKLWSRRDKLDFYWPALAQLGEQAVLNREIYTQGAAAGSGDNFDDGVFGYQERYAEYRYKPSMITGYYRSNSSAPLDAWHLSQEFSALPDLGPTFIEDEPPVDRVLAVTTNIESAPQFLADFYFDFKAIRPMPMFGIPASLGRF